MTLQRYDFAHVQAEKAEHGNYVLYADVVTLLANLRKSRDFWHGAHCEDVSRLQSEPDATVISTERDPQAIRAAMEDTVA